MKTMHKIEIGIAFLILDCALMFAFCKEQILLSDFFFAGVGGGFCCRFMPLKCRFAPSWLKGLRIARIINPC